MKRPYSYLNLGNNQIEKLSDLAEGFIYYKNVRVNLITGKKEDYSFLEFINAFQITNLKTNSLNYRLIHFFYESGHFIVQDKKEELAKIKALNDKQILAIDLSYRTSRIMSTKELHKPQSINLKKQNIISLLDYKKDFLKGFEQLLKGECYQFNLTYPVNYGWDGKPCFDDFFSKMVSQKEAAGAFAHGTYIPKLEMAFLSNSPECLFQARNKKDHIHLWTMPIKGTIDNKNLKTIENWEKLKSSKKDEGELNMITDLLRNDLSRIYNPSTKVICKKKMLQVPGLLHQFSLIEVKLPLNINLGKVINSLFPGGSITGAPKKNVMLILDHLEKGRERGFYTGSTLLIDKKRMAASINIRSAECDFKNQTMKVCAGGGVTVLSDFKNEYLEMEAKRKSFLSLFL